MDNENFQSPLSKGILAGLFAGIAATFFCLIFALIYRSVTGFHLFLIINFPAMIFICNLLLLTCGIIYFVFRKLFKLGNIIFILVFILLSVFCIWKTQSIQRSNIQELTIQFRQLLSGIIIILGVSAFFVIPFLFNNKTVEKHII